MISTKVFKKAIDKGLEISQFLILSYLNQSINIDDLVTVDKVKGQLNLLVRKGLVLVQGLQYVLTQKGKELYEEIESGEQTEEKRFDALSYEQIHQSLLDKLKALTGKTQISQGIKGGKPHSFMLTNFIDFRKRLEKVVKDYKVKDLNKVQQCLLNHIEECYKNNSWFPLMIYYISKDGNSPLMSDYDNYDESVQVNTEEPKKLVRTKDLFH